MADRVHVALFSNGYPHVDAALRAFQLATRHGGPFSRVIGEPFALRRDQFVRTVLETDSSHVLFLEGDLIPPEDTVERLLAVRAPVAAALYPHWHDDRVVTNVQRTTDDGWAAAVPPRVFSARRCLLGCVLVQRDVFANVPAPWFLTTMSAERLVSDDEWFCARVREAGFGIRCDGSLVCTALRQGQDLVALAGAALTR